MTAPRVHVIGAGLAGLSTAVNLVSAGLDISLYEGAGHAGGRCRSYHDPALGRTIDNGNHLLLGGNRAALDYLKNIGAENSLAGPERAEFNFLDLNTAERWTVALDAGFFLRAVFSKARRIPGSRPMDYLKALRLVRAGGNTTVAQCLGPDNALFRRFWEPLAVAVLNTAAEEGAASLMRPVIRETFGQGEAACRPLVARAGLSESFVSPALGLLGDRGAKVAFNRRLRDFQTDDGRVTALNFGDDTVLLNENDVAVLAVPPLAAAGLVPGLDVPDQSRAIVNVHFRLEREIEEFSFLGLIGGTAQWLFVRGDVVSVTVSAADDLVEEDAEKIAQRLWAEVSMALDLGEAPLPAHRIVKEKRATFAQTPEQIKRRPGAGTAWKNLFLAGDWTDTGLPATIEGAVRSGKTASESVLLLGSWA